MIARFRRHVLACLLVCLAALGASPVPAQDGSPFGGGPFGGSPTPAPTPAAASTPARVITSMGQRDQLIEEYYAKLRPAFLRKDWTQTVIYADLILQLDQAGEEGSTASRYRSRAVDELHSNQQPVPTPPPPVQINIQGVPDTIIGETDEFGLTPADGGFGQPGAPAGGQPGGTGSPFDQPNAGGAPNAFGQQGAMPTPNPFGQQPSGSPFGSQPTGGFGQAPGGAAPNPFGGAPAATPSPFGQPTGGGFGDTSGAAPGFGQPANTGGFGSAPTGGFGSPAATQATPTPSPAAAATTPAPAAAADGANDMTKNPLVIGGAVVVLIAIFGGVFYAKKGGKSGKSAAKKKSGKGGKAKKSKKLAGPGSGSAAPNPFAAEDSPFAANEDAPEPAGDDGDVPDPFDVTNAPSVSSSGGVINEPEERPAPAPEASRPEGKQVLAALNQSSEYDVLQELGMGGDDVSFDAGSLKRAEQSQDDSDFHDMKTRLEGDFGSGPGGASPAPAKPAASASQSASSSGGGVDLSGLDMSGGGLADASGAASGAGSSGGGDSGFNFGEFFGGGASAPSAPAMNPGDSTPPDFGGLMGESMQGLPRENDRIQTSTDSPAVGGAPSNPFGQSQSSDSFLNPFDMTIGPAGGGSAPSAPGAAPGGPSFGGSGSDDIFGRATEPSSFNAAAGSPGSPAAPAPGAPAAPGGDSSLSDVLFSEETMMPGVSGGAQPSAPAAPAGGGDQATAHSALFGGLDATMAPGFGAPAANPPAGAPADGDAPGQTGFAQTVALGEATGGVSEPTPAAQSAAQPAAPDAAYDMTMALPSGTGATGATPPPTAPAPPAAAAAASNFSSPFMDSPIGGGGDDSASPEPAAASAQTLNDAPAPPEDMTVAFSPGAAPSAPTAPAPAQPTTPPAKKEAPKAAEPAASWQAQLGIDLGGLDSVGGGSGSAPASAPPPSNQQAPAGADDATMMLGGSALPPRKFDPSDTQPSAFANASAGGDDLDATVMSTAPAASGRIRPETNALEVTAEDLSNIRTAGERDAEDKKQKQASRSKALLDEQRSLAEKAVEAHDWKKAVHYYSIAAALAPDDSSIREALGNARDERKRASKSDA